MASYHDFFDKLVDNVRFDSSKLIYNLYTHRLTLTGCIYGY